MDKKELLLIDLCARLPYGVICTDNRHGDSKVTEIDVASGVVYLFDVDEYAPIEICRPYLRPLSSITEEELKEFYIIEGMGKNPVIWNKPQSDWHFSVKGFDWLNAHHFDYRGLIVKSLAIEAPKGMYNIIK